MGNIGPNGERRNRHVILMGGSTGAPRYIFQFLDQLNALVKSQRMHGNSAAYPPVAIAVHHSKALDDTLGLASFERPHLQTRFIDDGMEVGSSGIYVCRGGAITQVQRNKRARVISSNEHPTPPIDLFFESAAKYWGLSPILVIYSGNEFDGAISSVNILKEDPHAALIVHDPVYKGDQFAPNLPQQTLARVALLDSGLLKEISRRENLDPRTLGYGKSPSFRQGRVYIANPEDIPSIALGIAYPP